MRREVKIEEERGCGRERGKKTYVREGGRRGRVNNEGGMHQGRGENAYVERERRGKDREEGGMREEEGKGGIRERQR